MARRQTFLAPQHAAKLLRSGVSQAASQLRGYESAPTKSSLVDLGFARWQCTIPAMVIPLFDATGQRAGTQIRPDNPRRDPKRGREIKYECPNGSESIIDVPPYARTRVLDPNFPLFVTEGAIKADAAASRELACVSVSGVWAWRHDDPFWSNVPLVDRRVYIVFDSDLSSNASVKKACVKLFRELTQRRADAQVIYLPEADGKKQGLDDFLAADHSVDDLLRLASPNPPESVEPEEYAGDASTYQSSPQGLARVTVKDDKAYIVPLTNFNARIAADIEVRDGEDTRHEFEITVQIAGAERIVRLPAEEFEDMKWVVPRIGGEAIVHAGFGTRDHARAAIQTLSGAIPTKVLYESLGWVHFDGRWLFLHAGGVIGTDPLSTAEADPDESATSNSLADREIGTTSPIRPIPQTAKEYQGPEVRVPNVLRHYALPKPSAGDQLIEDIQKSMSCLSRVAPQEIILPLLAGVFRIAIDRVDFGFHVVGPTNVGKTELVALFAQFFGGQLHSRNLPGSWGSTSNSVLATAWHAKNVLFPIDDFVPAGTQSDIARANREADRIFRSQGNQTGRGRCNRDGTPREGKSPRCMFVSTGEDVPEGHSLNSRILTLEIRPGDVIRADNDSLKGGRKTIANNTNSSLTTAQDAARSGQFARVMAAFLNWLAPQYDEVRRSVIEQKEAFRTVFQESGRLARSIDIAADLLAGFEIFLAFCSESQAIDDSQFDEYWQAIHDALHTTLENQQREASERDPANRFLRLLATAFTTGRAHLKNCSNEAPFENAQIWGWEVREGRARDAEAEQNGRTDDQSCYLPRGRHIGWISGGHVYLDSAAALSVVQNLETSSELRPLPLTSRSLGKALQAKNLLKSTGKDHYTTKVSVVGIQKRALHLESDAIVKYVGTTLPEQESLMYLLA